MTASSSSILRNLSNVWAAQGFKLVLSMAVSIVVTRYLGPANLGLLSVAAATVTMYSALVAMPQNGLIVRELAASGGLSEGDVLTTAFLMRAIGTLAQFCLAVLSAVVIGYDSYVVVAVVLSAMAYVSSPFMVISAAMEARSEFQLISRIEAIVAAASAVLKLVLVAFGAPVLAFAACAVADAAFFTAAYLLVNKQRLHIIPTRFVALLARKVWAEGVLLVCSGMAIALYTRADVLILGRLVGDSAVGQYAAAVRIMDLTAFLPAAIVSVFYPRLAAAHGAGEVGRYLEVVTRSCAATFWAAVLIAILLALASPFVVPLLLGSQFLEAAHILQIGVWSSVIVAFNMAVSSTIVLDRAVHISLLTTLAGAAVSIPLNFALVPLLGAQGPAIAGVIAQLAVAVAVVIMHPRKDVVRAALSALAPRSALGVLREMRGHDVRR